MYILHILYVKTMYHNLAQRYVHLSRLKLCKVNYKGITRINKFINAHDHT